MLVLERVCEALVFFVGLRAAMGLSRIEWFDHGWAVFTGSLRGRRVPVVAAALTSLLVVGALLEVFWPGALGALSDGPGSSWWQTFTAPFVQSGGAVGAVFNIVSAAVVLAITEWYWGRVAAAAIWLVGAWAPLGVLAGLAGYHESAGNVAAYSAGSSGATYFTLGTLCAAALLAGAGWERLAGAAALLVAVVMWLFVNDGHGVVLVEGGLLGVLLCGAYALLRRPARRADPAGCAA